SRRRHTRFSRDWSSVVCSSDLLGFPPDHPATDMQDTFFVTRKQAGAAATTLLRTHISTIQIREMMRRKPPLAVVAPGTVFRRDEIGRASCRERAWRLRAARSAT